MDTPLFLCAPWEFWRIPRMSIPTARRVWRLGVLAAAVALVAVAASPAVADKGHGHENDYHLTVMGTTDLHGNALDWDYFKNAEYDDKAKNDVGLEDLDAGRPGPAGQRSTQNAPHRRGRHHPGHSLGVLLRQVEPITSGGIHPMAAAMNAVGYDAAALGNHEFNYGIPLLRKFQSQLDFPLLGANAIDDATGKPAFAPYVIKKIHPAHGKPLCGGS